MAEVNVTIKVDIRLFSDSINHNPQYKTVAPINSRFVSELINSDVFDGANYIRYDVNSFSQLEINQCYDYLKHNGYEPYFKDGILTAKK